MASTTRTRATGLKTGPVGAGGLIAVKDFGVFIDTHRDDPSVTSFDDEVNLRRGMCRPIAVVWSPPDTANLSIEPDHMGWLWDAEGYAIKLHEKHRFVEVDWWRGFVMDFIMENGYSPTSKDPSDLGQMPTKYLRDARKKVYKLKSFRQMVRHHEAVTGTTGRRRVIIGGSRVFTVPFVPSKTP